MDHFDLWKSLQNGLSPQTLALQGFADMGNLEFSAFLEKWLFGWIRAKENDMSTEPNHSQDELNEKGYIPASPVKRTLAWIGLAYALLFLGLTTYFFFTGTMLGNLAPLLTLPGLVGMGAVSIVSWRSTGRPGKWPAILLAVLCWVLALVTLPLAVVGLMSNFSAEAAATVTGVLTMGG